LVPNDHLRSHIDREMQLDTSLLVEQSPPSPWDSRGHSTNRGMNRQTSERTHGWSRLIKTIAQPHRQRHKGHSTKKHTHTHTHTEQNHRARTHGQSAGLGPLHRARPCGEGAPADLPRHRHTSSTQTGRCPQPVSQPASLSH
jgi:hypothetical protein